MRKLNGVGEVVLDQLDETEKFFYSLLPTEKNGGKIRVVSLPFILMLYEMWWAFVEQRHGLFGEIGIRRGWKLVACKREKRMVFEGRLEEKGRDYN